MQIETHAIVRPPTTGYQDLASRLSKGFRDASHSVAVYSSPEVCALASEDLSDTTLLVTSPKQCIEASGDEPVFLSKVACARKRILASVGPVHSAGYLARLRRGIHFDALFDLGLASQKTATTKCPTYLTTSCSTALPEKKNRWQRSRQTRQGVRYPGSWWDPGVIGTGNF